MKKKKRIILIVTVCLYVGLFAYGMYNKNRVTEDPTRRSATISTETQPAVITITSYDYLHFLS